MALKARHASGNKSNGSKSNGNILKQMFRREGKHPLFPGHCLFQNDLQNFPIGDQQRWWWQGDADGFASFDTKNRALYERHFGGDGDEGKLFIKHNDHPSLMIVGSQQATEINVVLEYIRQTSLSGEKNLVDR